ncbi:uncharacterized protein LOC124252886 [Haliotis rubra]|uniref:uncharacterized protein LOC124252886 n=1 Tax=Haliotis rubra TaxID=36100 RepID=UPI001EE5B4FC|nr:uncharacterized protein LOC124252886 [Haliotis rubra]
MAALDHQVNLLDMCGVDVMASMLLTDMILVHCDIEYHESRLDCLNSCYGNPSCIMFDFIPSVNECCFTQTSDAIEFEYYPGGSVYSLTTVKSSCRHSGYTFLRTSNRCVKIVTNNSTGWENAERVCRAEGGRLVQLYMIFTEGDLIDTVYTSGSKVFHVGNVSDVGGGRLGRTWENGVAATIEGTCLQVFQDSSDTDVECTDVQPYICEIP